MIYVVKSGDTLFKITQRYVGDGNRYRELLPVNPQITNPDYIEVGDMLNIPDSWTGGSSNNLPAPLPSYTPPVEAPSEGMSNNTKVILVASVAVAAALAYWYFGRTPVAANPMGDTGDDITDPESEYQGGSS